MIGKREEGVEWEEGGNWEEGGDRIEVSRE